MGKDLKGLWVVGAIGLTLVGTIFIIKKLSQIEVTDEGISFSGKDNNTLEK
jgi:hypothetical protein